MTGHVPLAFHTHCADGSAVAYAHTCVCGAQVLTAVFATKLARTFDFFFFKSRGGYKNKEAAR